MSDHNKPDIQGLVSRENARHPLARARPGESRRAGSGPGQPELCACVVPFQLLKAKVTLWVRCDGKKKNEKKNEGTTAKASSLWVSK